MVSDGRTSGATGNQERHGEAIPRRYEVNGPELDSTARRSAHLRAMDARTHSIRATTFANDNANDNAIKLVA
jgi:hypothetical protein